MRALRIQKIGLCGHIKAAVFNNKKQPLQVKAFESNISRIGGKQPYQLERKQFQCSGAKKESPLSDGQDSDQKQLFKKFGIQEQDNAEVDQIQKARETYNQKKDQSNPSSIDTPINGISKQTNQNKIQELNNLDDEDIELQNQNEDQDSENGLDQETIEALQSIDDDDDDDDDESTDFEDNNQMNLFEEKEDNRPGIKLKDQKWAQIIYDYLSDYLFKQTGFEELQIYSMEVNESSKSLELRIDKLSDIHGSPTLDEISDVSRKVYEHLEEKLGEEAAGFIDLQISSPGAERMIRFPQDFERFHKSPLRIAFWEDHGEIRKSKEGVFDVINYDPNSQIIQLKYAKVRANLIKGKGRFTGIWREKYNVKFDDIKQVNLHLNY